MSTIAHGTFVYNAFLHSAQTDQTYKWLADSAARMNIDLDLVSNAALIARIDDTSLVKAPEKSDFILFWNKDVMLGEALEAKGMRLFNPSRGIYLCDNKAFTVRALAGKIRMPITLSIPMTFDTIGYNEFGFIDDIAKVLSYPFVIKECYGSYGGQVYLADSKEKAIDILKKCGTGDLIAQEYISTSYGRDIRAYVVGDRVVAAMERRNDHDFRANITNGGSAHPITLTKSQEEMAIRAAKLLNLDFAGVDLLYLEDDEPILCEVNSNAQFIGLYEASGIMVPDHIFEHILRTIS